MITNVTAFGLASVVMLACLIVVVLCISFAATAASSTGGKVGEITVHHYVDVGVNSPYYVLARTDLHDRLVNGSDYPVPAVNVALRTWALRAGWHAGIGVANRLGAPVLQLGLRIAGPGTALALGVMLPIVTAWLFNDFEANAVTASAVVAAVGILLARWIWPTLGGIRYGLTLVVLAALAGWL